MVKYLLAATLFLVPLCGHSQSYADSPFYKPSPPAPATAHVQGWQHGAITANGIMIDLSESVSASEPDLEAFRGWSLASHVDGTKPAQTFHFLIEFINVNATFGYDLLVQPVEGTDGIKCTFSRLTVPPADKWPYDEGIAPVALSADLTPLVIKSGDTISIAMLPLGQGKSSVVTQYIRLTLEPDYCADASEPTPVCARRAAHAIQP
jgi:hypothetical protein